MDGFPRGGEHGEVLIPSAHFYFIYMSTETDHSQGPFAEQRHRTVGQTVSGFADLAYGITVPEAKPQYGAGFCTPNSAGLSGCTLTQVYKAFLNLKACSFNRQFEAGR